LVLGELEETGKIGATEGHKGCNEYSAKDSNTTISKDNPKQSRGTAYLSKRLKRDNPELFSKVQSGELSAHAAAKLQLQKTQTTKLHPKGQRELWGGA